MLEKPVKTIEDVENANAQMSVTFRVFWGINALLTFVFGYEFISPLFVYLLDPLPFGSESLGILSGILGGVFSLLLLDVAYLRWRDIKLNNSDTHEQYLAASTAESLAFYMSLFYSGLTLLLLVFGRLITPQWLAIFDWVGAISFITVAIGHLWLWRQWQVGSEEVQRKQAATELYGKQLSLNLRHTRRAADDALRVAYQKATEGRGAVADELGQQIGDDLIQSQRSALPTSGEIADLQRRIDELMRMQQYVDELKAVAAGGQSDPYQFHPSSNGHHK